MFHLKPDLPPSLDTYKGDLDKLLNFYQNQEEQDKDRLFTNRRTEQENKRLIKTLKEIL